MKSSEINLTADGIEGERLIMRWDQIGLDPELDEALALLGDQDRPPTGEALMLWLWAWPQYYEHIEEFVSIWLTASMEYRFLSPGPIGPQISGLISPYNV